MWASLVAQTVKNLPAMWDTQVRSLDWEDPLEKGMATHSGRIPWTKEPGGYSPWDSPGKHTGVGCHFLCQGIFPIQVLSPGLPHCRHILYHLSH